MENLFIDDSEKNPFIPEINFDATTGVCVLAGESYLEDSASFYAKLMDWLSQYMGEVGDKIRFDFRLTYFNTSSSKGILDILQMLKAYKESGKEVRINWYYPEKDSDNLDDANDYIDDVGVEINVIPYS